MNPSNLYYFSELLWMFRIFCIFIQILESLCQFLQKDRLNVEKDFVESVGQLGSITLLKIWIFLILEQRISFHLFRYSLIDFNNVLWRKLLQPHHVTLPDDIFLSMIWKQKRNIRWCPIISQQSLTRKKQEWRCGCSGVFRDIRLHATTVKGSTG